MWDKLHISLGMEWDFRRFWKFGFVTLVSDLCHAMCFCPSSLQAHFALKQTLCFAHFLFNLSQFCCKVSFQRIVYSGLCNSYCNNSVLLGFKVTHIPQLRWFQPFFQRPCPVPFLHMPHLIIIVCDKWSVDQTLWVTRLVSITIHYH